MEIESIWGSPLIKEIPRKTRTLPAACESCIELADRWGSCRGAALHLTGRNDNDQICPFCEAQSCD